MSVEIVTHLDDALWRLNNLYQIINKEGQAVAFQMNPTQWQLYKEMHDKNVILKARQMGYTTFIDLFIFDACLWNRNKEGAIIAHTKPDAMEIFRRKIQFPYDNLPTDIRKRFPLTTDSKSQIGFSNGSVINVGTSMRSATLQYLHVSELGKIAKIAPEKAREIMTGAMEAVGSTGLIWVESTGEGRSGQYYDLCERSQKKIHSREKLSRMDFKFHFFAWFDCEDYFLDEPVAITKPMQEYFAEAETKIQKTRPGFKFTLAQKAWYIKKREILGEDVKREYPSTPDEAFESGIEGTYFRSQFRAMREQGRICKVPYQDGVAVDTWWDLGMNDSMTIWFTQDVGREVHVINYYENSGEGLEFYRDILDEYRRTLNYRYHRHVAPHDINVRELGTGISRLETARKLGIAMEVAPKIESKMDAIQKARSVMSFCWFDLENCAQGLEHLEEYRKQWDENYGVYKDKPLHDEHSHGADAFQTFAVAHDFVNTVTARPRARAKRIVTISSKGWA